MKTIKSSKLFEEAQKCLVGGVNSPVRAFKAVGGTPLFIEKANGAYLTDADGNNFIDFVGSWGPMIFGHRPAPVMKAVKAMLEKGTSFGAPAEVEVRLAQLMKSAYPGLDKIRFTNSGTEATMSALRLARAATNRERILKFEGGYHGHSDSLLVSAGSGATTFGIPSSKGVPEHLAQHTWVLPYNDIQALEEIFRTQGPNIAALIVEPVAGNMGLVEPHKNFLQKIRQLTKAYGTILIFDEVMTGFRLGWGGASELLGIKPDLACFGKIIGGGFPVGAFGGPNYLMDMVAPLGPVYQAGTLSGNPIAMAAGLAALTMLKEKKPYRALEQATSNLASFVRAEGKKLKLPIQVNQVGSMFTIFFNEFIVHDYLTATQSNGKLYGKFFHALLNEGVYFPPSQFEAAFVSTQHSKTIMTKAKAAIKSALKSLVKKS